LNFYPDFYPYWSKKSVFQSVVKKTSYATKSIMDDEDLLSLHHETIAALCACVAAVGYSPYATEKVTGVKRIRRNRVVVTELFRELGPDNVRRSFRMTAQSFWQLLEILEPALTEIRNSNTQHPNQQAVSRQKLQSKPPNGYIDNAVRLGAAIRYFAGGDTYDLAIVFKISRIEVFHSMWLIVKAVRRTKQLEISYPTSHIAQQIIAYDFSRLSDININICAGAVDGLLIWTNKPTKPDLKRLKIGAKKFFCGRKKKFGLNLQAVCDSRKKFLFVEVSHPGATSDFLAFARSKLHQQLATSLDNQTFLSPGLAIFGDNAYENTSYMVTPYKGVTGGPRDAFNFFQSQLRITVECAFGMLVHRWSILRRPLPLNISAKKAQMLVYCLCQLHNFCISQQEGKAPNPTHADMVETMMHGGLLLHHFDPECQRLDDLLDGGANHRGEAQRRNAERVDRSNLPAQKLLTYITQHGYNRPQQQRR
jgi:hypothetical protein